MTYEKTLLASMLFCLFMVIVYSWIVKAEEKYNELNK
jgi:hypothetical protein